MRKQYLLSILSLLLITTTTAQFCGAAPAINQTLTDCPCNTTWEADSTGNYTEQPNYTYSDRFGNQYCNLTINDPCIDYTLFSFVPPSPDCSTPLFDVYFTGSTSTQMEEVVCQVFHDLDVLINEVPRSATNAKVKIEVSTFNNQSTTSSIAYASPYIQHNSLSIHRGNGRVYSAINGTNNDNNEWDGFININTSTTCYCWL